jgi:hypothetical protein
MEGDILSKFIPILILILLFEAILFMFAAPFFIHINQVLIIALLCFMIYRKK